MDEPPEIRLTQVSKRLGSVWANQRISLDVRRGEIHAIVGENGAGKSTLMKLLHGDLRPDEGAIALRGAGVRFKSPRQANEAGLGMAYQQPFCFPQLTVLENVAVGYPSSLWRLVRRGEVRARVAGLCDLFGFELPLDVPARELSFAHRRQIDLLRMIYRGASLLILDEPTSLLSPPESDKLLELLRTLRARRHTILFVSHRLSEVFAIADRLTILSKGRCVGTLRASEVSHEVVASLIASGGEDKTDGSWRELPDSSDAHPVQGPRRVVMRLESIRSVPSTEEAPLQSLSLEIAQGESLGIGGVVGSGQRTLARLLVGIGTPAEGVVRLDGDDITRLSVGERRIRGVRWLPANPVEEGMPSEGSILESYLLGSQRDERFQARGWLREAVASRWAATSLREGQVRFDGLHSSVSSLSGGNLQKMAILRTLEGSPRLVVMEQPTRGLDIQGQAWLRACLRRRRDEGVAFLIISHDLDDLFALCDRIGVLYGGRLMGVRRVEEARREALIRWMLGDV